MLHTSMQQQRSCSTILPPNAPQLATLDRHTRTWVHLRMGSSVISSVVSSTWLITPQIWYDLPLVLVGTCGGRVRGEGLGPHGCMRCCSGGVAAVHPPSCMPPELRPSCSHPSLPAHLLNGALEAAVPGLHRLGLLTVQHAAQVSHLSRW